MTDVPEDIEVLDRELRHAVAKLQELIPADADQLLSALMHAADALVGVSCITNLNSTAELLEDCKNAESKLNEPLNVSAKYAPKGKAIQSASKTADDFRAAKASIAVAVSTLEKRPDAPKSS